MLSSELLRSWTLSIIWFSKNQRTQCFRNWMFPFLEYQMMNRVKKKKNRILSVLHHRRNPLESKFEVVYNVCLNYPV
jgi:hypothetical protein